MKLIQSIKSVCLWACLMFMAQTAIAEIRAGAFNVSPSVGGYIFEGNQHLENGLTYGLGLGYQIDKHWATEAAFNFVGTEFDLGGRDVNVYGYHIDGLYHFMPAEKLVPYIAAGFGGITFNPDNADSENDFALNYGAGLNYFFSKNVALRTDLRHVISFNETGNNLLYTVGLNFFFGGEKAKVMAEEKVVIMADAPKVEEKVRAAVSEPKTIILAFEDVHFDFDKAALTPEAQMILKRNILMLKSNPNAKVRIAGYTSASGTDIYNQGLSERRANAVKAFLIKEGLIAPDRLSMIGYGNTRPAMHEAAPKVLYSDAAKANMRVLFEIIVK